MSHWIEERRRDDERHAERNRKAEDYDRVAAELDRLRLTDAEREAISEAIAVFDEFAGDEVYVAALRGLLDRLSSIKTCDPDRPQPVESTPEPVATPGDGAEQSECTEPVAWLVEGCEYDTGCEFQYVALLQEQAEAAAAKGARLTPLYRQPPAVAWQLVHECERLRDEVMLLKDAIRRLAEQDATLSVCNGNVTVEMDGTLTDAEREAIEFFTVRGHVASAEDAATLRGLLERTAQNKTDGYVE